MPRQYTDTETRRRQVAEATLRTLVEDGVAGFTTRAVAERVGISDGTLFRHFGNKGEIVAEAMARLEVHIDEALVDTGAPLADLEAMFRHRAAFVGSEGSVGRLIFSDQLVHLAGDVGRDRIEGWRRRSVAFITERLAQLQARGLLTTTLDPRHLSVLIQGALLTFAMQASLGTAGEPTPLARRIDRAWHTLSTLLIDDTPAVEAR